MKAIVFDGPGDTSVLQLREVADPVPSSDGVLVRLRAAALNQVDIWLRTPGVEISLPHIPGSDGAGVVERVIGESDLKPGDPVLINPALPCGRCAGCEVGAECRMVDILGYDTQGTCAEYVTVPASQVYPMPPHLSFVEGACLPLTFLTAWRMLVTKAAVQPDEVVFVWGATGGLGSAGVILATALGARVLAAVGDDADTARLRSLGAVEVFNYHNADLVDEVRRWTAGAGADVVFETVGEPSWNRTLGMLRDGGRVVIAGTTGGDVASQDLSEIYYRQQSILGSRMGSPSEFKAMLNFVASNQLRPCVDQVFKLSETAEAHRLLESSKYVGKIGIEIPH